MSRRNWSSLIMAGALAASPLLIGCEDVVTSPDAPQLSVGSDNGNGVLVEVGEHRAPFGLLVGDRESQLLLYYRWDNGFCGAGPAPTDFVLSTFHDVIRIDETWHYLDKTNDYWLYVYPWNGTPAFPGCNYLRNTPRLATGRGDRLLVDNDFYPIAPYAPGPGANAYTVKLNGNLTTPSGAPAQLSAQTHIIVDADGSTIRQAKTTVRLSPDPR